MVLENLTEEIKKSGIKKGVIADRLGITHACLNNKLTGKSDFSVYEALELMRVLGRNESDFTYFFAKKVE